MDIRGNKDSIKWLWDEPELGASKDSLNVGSTVKKQANFPQFNFFKLFSNKFTLHIDRN